MIEQADQITIIDVTADNVSDVGIYCLKDKKSQGYKSKVEWFKSKINGGWQIKIAADSKNKQLGFIELIRSELAWRPIKANNYIFIQCITLFVSEAKNNGIGSILLNECERDAIKKTVRGFV